MKTKQNKAIINRFNEEVWNKGNVDAVDELMASNYVAHFPGMPPLDRDGQKHFISANLAAFPDGQVTIDDLITEGDKVALRWIYRGTHQSDFQGIPATGKPFTLEGISVFRVAGGKLVEQWAEFDALGMMQQLGVVPTLA